MKRLICSFALLLTITSVSSAEENNFGRPFGPPAEVIAAWENGEGDALPGPPEWVIAMRGGDDAARSGMPPWVAARHERAWPKSACPGPPPEVIEAWENGEGDSLPGPPQFVLDILAMFRGQR